MLSRSKFFKRPASSNPKLPSIQSDPGPAETNEKAEAEQLTIIPVKPPPDNNTWPPPLNLAPLKPRRKSLAVDARDVASGPHLEKGSNEKKIDISSWRRLHTANGTKTTEFERSGKEDIGSAERKSAKSRLSGEDISAEFKDDINRLRKDKRIMSSLLKQCQRELTKNESAVKDLSQENGQLKKEMLALKSLLLENKEKQHSENKFSEEYNFSENNDKKEDSSIKFESLETEKDRKILLLQRDIKILKDCLNNVYRKISFFDHSEDGDASEFHSILIMEDENFETGIEKLNNCVEHIVKAYNELYVNFGEIKKSSEHSSKEEEIKGNSENLKMNETTSFSEADSERLIEEAVTVREGTKHLSSFEGLVKEEAKQEENKSSSGSEKSFKGIQQKQKRTQSFSGSDKSVKGREAIQTGIKNISGSGRSIEQIETKHKEIKSLSDIIVHSKESIAKDDAKQELEKKIEELQIDNSKLEELLLVCCKTQKELKSTVKTWEEKCDVLQEENSTFQTEINKMKNELENFQLSIMETIRLALDVEFPETKVPTDVLTAAIVEIAEECQALRALIEKMESSEKEQQKLLAHLSHCILDMESKLQQEGRSVASLQDALQEFEAISIPKTIDLDKAVMKIYNNSLEWENNIVNKLKSIGIAIDEPTTDICVALDRYVLENDSSKTPLQPHKLYEIQKEIKRHDVGTQTKESNVESKSNNVLDIFHSSLQGKEISNDSGLVCSAHMLDKSMEPDISGTFEENSKFQQHQKNKSDVSVDLLHELIQNSNQASPKLTSSISRVSTTNQTSINANDPVDIHIGNSQSDLEKNSLLKNLQEFQDAITGQGQALCAKDDEIDSSSKGIDIRTDQKKASEVQLKLFGGESAAEVQEPVIVKKESKREEAVPYDRNYINNTGAQLSSTQTHDIGTQVEEPDQWLLNPAAHDQNKHEIGVQTTFFPPQMFEDPERMQDLEMTVEEMRDVEKHHMNVACDLAEKLNEVSQNEAKLKIIVESLKEDKARTIEAVKEEWLEIEKQYRDEITAWQLSASKQGEVLRQLQIHFEQAQYMIYEKEVEIAEMQRTIGVLQEKLQYDRTTKRYLSHSDRNAEGEADYGSDKKFEMGPEEVLQNQIKQLNEQLAATKLCLRTSRTETTKCLQKEMQYYNDIVQKKEQHIKRLQTELARQRAEIEAKEAIILRQRREIRQSNLRWHKCEKDNWSKDDLIMKLKQQIECSVSQTEQEKLSTIGTRCLEEQHHQILEEYKSRIKELENIFSSSIGNGDSNTDHRIYSSLWRRSSNISNSSRLEVIEEQQQFNELFLYDIIKQCEDTYLNLVNTLAHALGITELEGAASLVIVPHTEWSTLIGERRKDQKRFVNAIEILKTLAQNEYVDQEERLRKTEMKLQAATEQITRLQENNRSKLHELKQAEKILRITRRSLERERSINASIKQNRKKLEQLTARIISQKENDMFKVEEDIRKKKREIMKTEKKLESIETKLASDPKKEGK